MASDPNSKHNRRRQKPLKLGIAVIIVKVFPNSCRLNTPTEGLIGFNIVMLKKSIIPAVIAVVLTLGAPAGFAQSGSMTGTPALLHPNGRPMTMSETSLTFQAPPKPHAYQIGDIIYLQVDQRTAYSNTADNQRRKQIETESSLTGWMKFAGFLRMPVAAAGPLPEIGGTIDHRTQNRGRMNREERLNFEIACRITDIRDNGNLVIEGKNGSGIGEEGSNITISGIIRPDTISRDYQVSSSMVESLEIREIPRGNVYDTVRRPWGTRLIDQLKPF